MLFQKTKYLTTNNLCWPINNIILGEVQKKIFKENKTYCKLMTFENF